jgi:hypothetical protein
VLLVELLVVGELVVFDLGAQLGFPPNSSLDTDCTGIGERNRDSAEDRRSSSSGLIGVSSDGGWICWLFVLRKLLRT